MSIDRITFAILFFVIMFLYPCNTVDEINCVNYLTLLCVFLAMFSNVDVTRVHSNRAFCNKIWQAFRYVTDMLGKEFIPQASIEVNNVVPTSTAPLYKEMFVNTQFKRSSQ